MCIPTPNTQNRSAAARGRMSNFNNNNDERDQQRTTNSFPDPNAFDDPAAESLLLGADASTRQEIYSRAAAMEQLQLRFLTAASQQQHQAHTNSAGVSRSTARSAGTGGVPPSRLPATEDLFRALRQEHQGPREQYLQQMLLQSQAQARAQHQATSFASARQQVLNPAASLSHHHLSATAQAQQGSAVSSSANLMLLDHYRMLTQSNERAQLLQQERLIMQRVHAGNFLDQQLLLQSLQQQRTVRSSPPAWAQLEAAGSPLRQHQGSPNTISPTSQGCHGGGSNLGSVLHIQERVHAEQSSLLANAQGQMPSCEFFPQQQQMHGQVSSATALAMDPAAYSRLAAQNASSAVLCESLYAILGGDSKSSDEIQRRKNFPEKLMDLLNMPAVQHIICWLPHGKSFIIVRPKVFAAEIMPSYFRQAKYASFTRKLNRWGFRQVTKGPDHGAFHHKLFQREKPLLCLKMFCGGTAYPKSAAKRRAAAAASEEEEAGDLKPKAADASSQSADKRTDLSRMEPGDDSETSESSDEEIKEEEGNVASNDREWAKPSPAVAALALNLKHSSSSKSYRSGSVDSKIPPTQLKSCIGRGA
jgi:hypothetical protein